MDKEEVDLNKEEDIEIKAEIFQNKTGAYTEIPSFNSVTEHYRNVVGVPTQVTNLKSLPRFIRWFGYFFLAAFSIGLVIFIVGYILQQIK